MAFIWSPVCTNYLEQVVKKIEICFKKLRIYKKENIKKANLQLEDVEAGCGQARVLAEKAVFLCDVAVTTTK